MYPFSPYATPHSPHISEFNSTFWDPGASHCPVFHFAFGSYAAYPILPIYHLGFEHSLDATILSFTTSYYYAHARAKDYHVPTVPMRMDTDGSLTPWVPPVAAGREVGGSGGLGTRRI